MQAARLWLLAALPALTGQVWWSAADVEVGEGPAFAPRQDIDVVVAGGAEAGEGPAFAPRQDTDVVVAAGAQAELVCRVLRLGDKAVSWVRSRDLQILSHAGGVFTADARVAAAARGGRHALRLAAARAADAGRYECQVNTEPKLSLFFNLAVLEESSARVQVQALGARAVWVRAGREATLACEARYAPPFASAARLPALALHWTREDGDRRLPLEARAGGVSLAAAWRGARLESRVRLARARPADAGRYRCAAPAAADTITLHVTESDSAEDEEGAEGVEAMQRDQSPPSGSAPHSRASTGELVLWILALAALLR